MLDGIFRSNFRTKCKSLLTRIKTRLEVIKKRRNSMQTFLKKDIAELLKSNLDRNAYGRAEGLYKELVLSSCYEFVGQCCASIAENLKEMHKQSDCPEQCKVAVGSLIYAAARFADLPELRDLRNLFHDKYSKTVDPFASKEFMENLKSRPPTTEMKLQLMQALAQEFSVKWDSQLLEEQLRNPSTITHEVPANPTSGNGDNGGAHNNLLKNQSTSVQEKGKQVEVDRQINEEQTHTTRTRRRNSCSELKENIAEESQYLSSIQEETRPENNTPYRKPFTNRIVPAPYIRTNNNNTNEENDSSGKAKPIPKPRSVRTKFLNPSASTNATSSTEQEIDPRQNLSARDSQARPRHDLLSDDEEIIAYFGRKTAVETGVSVKKDGSETPKLLELPPPPGKRRYLFCESQSASPVTKPESLRRSEKSSFVSPDQPQFEAIKAPIRHGRSKTTFVNDGHQVHTRMPDFDKLAERISSLKNV
ncbi:uncharacterized protein LOC130814037 isoform X2 [Amaranthus tricolor]|uniref:uncharacterized protein LOC130814037 isoform X2 n=1 Tax=Amaranthus tricolor TaxID=29722 RepID=UPI002584C706|nr:uncharacterized protein LOC130814037 isoform X2 [Amaranthus tricolor]